ncbi:MAG: metal ABC transporter substrate-binding protein [Lachnospiraceae bacterium]|nr:metal ABC transporter substrate-binding protein [Lachnospiraceae bacterium]
MKKTISFICAAILAAFTLSACGPAASEAPVSDSKNPESSSIPAAESKSYESAPTGEKLQIVASIFPEYDWVMNVLGSKADRADVTLLLDSGVDLHSYQPTADDILTISTCDLFIYVGGESDAWVDDALKESVNKEMLVINLLDVLGNAVKEEESVEGMQETEHAHEHEEGEEHKHEEGEEHEREEGGIEYDEHVWLSLKNAAVLVNSIADALQTLDADNADAYKANAAAYIEKLDALDAAYADAVEAAPIKTLLFGDRFPFRYLTDDYGLDYYAAFAGCSAETEASFETVTFLAGKVDELSLHSILTIEGNDRRIAETIAANTASKDQQILTLDSMQATTAEDIAEGAAYLSVMESNLEILKEALK